MDITLTVAGLAVSLIGAWLGAYFGYRYQVRMSREQDRRKLVQDRNAHLRDLKDEFSYNQVVLLEIEAYLSGPVIDDLWAPSAAASRHLRCTAWDTLVRAGVLSSLDIGDQKQFRRADRLTREVARTIQTFEANWRRAYSWYDYDVRSNNPQPISHPQLVKDQWLREAQVWTRDAMKELDEAIQSLVIEVPEGP